MYALDALGASSRATFGVAVSAYEGGVEDLSALVDDIATEALAAGDTDTVMQVLSSLVLAPVRRHNCKILYSYGQGRDIWLPAHGFLV